MKQLDILVISAHPDDAELGAGGTIAKSIAQGKKVGILDLTKGELGTRGTPELRALEAQNAANILGVEVRENVGLPDGFLENTKGHQLAIIPFIRKYRPRIVLSNAISDRHPDHAKGAKLTSDACFLSGLKSIETHDSDGQVQEAWRPEAIYHFVQDFYIKPDFVVDISSEFELKMKAVMAFSSQFYTGVAQDPKEVTPISTPQFVKFLEGRAREYGRVIGVEFGEGFTVERAPGVDDLFNLK
jgi:bacillithiol biosynthesis deacetylase BshB1